MHSSAFQSKMLLIGTVWASFQDRLILDLPLFRYALWQLWRYVHNPFCDQTLHLILCALAGLCGNFDGDPSNDFTLQTGNVIQLEDDFCISQRWVAPFLLKEFLIIFGKNFQVYPGLELDYSKCWIPWEILIIIYFIVMNSKQRLMP